HVANGGTTPSTPMATLSALRARYDLEPGAVIHIDAGTYTLAGTLVIDAADAGVRIEGAGADRTILNRGNTQADAIQLVNADGVQFANLAITGGTYGVLVGASDSDDLLFENLRVFGNNFGGINIAATNDRAVIRNSEFYGVP